MNMPKVGATLKFEDVHLSVKNAVILEGVSGKAEPGQILALLGPSGSGKTTLLHVISGRLGELHVGGVTLNDSPLTKTLRRQIALVLQDDIFFANLTLRETLLFTARLRLPSSMSYKAKVQRVHELVDSLDLNKCLDTRIGDYLCRGLSGGEMKRANIACELLTDPAVLILDEPTSGLDSTSSLNLIQTLKTYAKHTQKTVVMSIHQPSSQIYHLFDQLLLLAEGQVIYFGRADDALGYFESLGLPCQPNYNPADFLMDKAKGSDEELSIIFEAAERNFRNTATGASRTSDGDQSHVNPLDISLQDNFHINTNHYHSLPPDQRNRPVVHNESTPNFGLITTPRGKSISITRLPMTVNGPSGPVVPFPNSEGPSPERRQSTARRPRTPSEISSPNPGDLGRRERRNTLVTISGVLGGYHNGVMSELSFVEAYQVPKVNRRALRESVTSGTSDPEPKWPTTFLDQLRTLTGRNFRNSRHVILSKFLVVKNVLLAVIVGLLWFQTNHDEARIHDKQGFYFFGLVYWGFESMFLVMNVFPSERPIVFKERQSGAYRLSAYYMAKTFSLLPLLMVMPSVYFVITYWMAGLNASAMAFMASWCAMLMNVLVGESIALAISAYAPSLQEAVVVVSLFMLTTLILGGFYIERLPQWLEWSSYLSYTFYFYTLQMQIEFGWNGEPVKCKENNSMFDACHHNATHVESVQVLDHMKLLPLSLSEICGILIGIFVVFRVLGYLILRFIRTPE